MQRQAGQNLKVEDQLHKRRGKGIQVDNDKESGSPFPGYTLICLESSN